MSPHQSINQMEEEHQKWEGKATAQLKGVAAELVWPLLEDFCSLDRWLPTIDTCHQVQGVKGRPGMIRYCASTITTVDGSIKMIRWCHEKLIAIDPVVRCLSYEVVNNNMGIKSYVSTIKVLPSGKGCEIQWSFLADPVEGLSYLDLLNYLNFALQGMAEQMEVAFWSTLLLQ